MCFFENAQLLMSILISYTMGPLLRGHPDKRPPLLKGHFSDAKGVASRGDHCNPNSICLYLSLSSVTFVRGVWQWSCFQNYIKIFIYFIQFDLFKAFLNMYVDDSVMSSHSCRRSVSEDDNPPSPVGMDTLDSFMTGHQAAGLSAGGSSRVQKQDGLCFHSPMTPPSNPHTPASPSTSRISQVGSLSVSQVFRGKFK